MKIALTGTNTGLKKIFESKEKQCRLIEGVMPPGFEIGPHTHPYGEDCALVLSGSLIYYLDHDHTTSVQSGELVIGYQDVIHGYSNRSLENIHLVIFATPQETGLEYPEKDDAKIIQIPFHERKIDCHSYETSLTSLSHSPLSSFSAIQVTGTYEETRENGICKMLVDWIKKEAYVFDNEPVSILVKEPTMLLRYCTKS